LSPDGKMKKFPQKTLELEHQGLNLVLDSIILIQALLPRKDGAIIIGLFDYICISI
jgi:hypothetical protein